MTNFTGMFRLDGRVALVAGAASGIGQAAAKGLAAAGATAICADLNADGASATAAAIRESGGKAESIALDVTDEAAVAGAVQKIACADVSTASSDPSSIRRSGPLRH